MKTKRYELVGHKFDIFFRAMDPGDFIECLQKLTECAVAMVVALRDRFARKLALGASCSEVFFCFLILYRV